ncbi:hypothetical protein EBU71_19335, partial [bacterium]|nr:hypothetical protein [Candidatus Elulimicrobium humile]
MSKRKGSRSQSPTRKKQKSRSRSPESSVGSWNSLEQEELLEAELDYNTPQSSQSSRSSQSSNLDEDEFNERVEFLRLGLDGKSPKSLKKFISPSYQEPDIPFWHSLGSNNYNKIGNICFSYIVNKYSNSHTCCVSKIIEIKVDTSNKNKKYVKYIHPHYGFNQSIQKCIQRKSDIILIPYAVYEWDPITILEITPFSGHQCLMMVNNILKTVEYYDPNGHLSHKLAYDNQDYYILNEELSEFKKYKKLD